MTPTTERRKGTTVALLREWEEEIETTCEVDVNIECETAGESIIRVVTTETRSDGIRTYWMCESCDSTYEEFEFLPRKDV